MTGLRSSLSCALEWQQAITAWAQRLHRADDSTMRLRLSRRGALTRLKPSLRLVCARGDERLSWGGQRQVLVQRLGPVLPLRYRLRSQGWLNQRSHGLDSCGGRRQLRRCSWLQGIKPEALLGAIGQSLDQQLQG